VALQPKVRDHRGRGVVARLTTNQWLKILGGAVAIVLWGLFFSDLASTGKWIFDSSFVQSYRPLADLQARYRDAHTILTHGNVYAIHAETSTYPPIVAYIFVPFRWMGLGPTMTLWTVGNMVALSVIFAITIHRWLKVSPVNAWFASTVGLAPAAIFAFYPYRSVLLWGQMGVFLTFLVFVDLFALPRRYRGLLIGVAGAIKLLPLLFLAWFIAKREISAALRTVVAFAVVTLFAAALWPHASAQYWFHVLPSARVGKIKLVTRANWVRGVGTLGDQSIRGLLGRPPFTWLHTLPWLFVALLVLAGGIVVTTRLVKEERELAAFVLLSLLTVLVSPVSWLHYWAFIGLAPFLAIVEWRRDRPLAISSIVLALSTCANLENKILTQAPITTMAPIVLFVVRNLYVLGGLQFLTVAALRTFRRPTVALEGRSPEEKAWSPPDADATASVGAPIGRA
jgi:alpha-1,2-mannosyltransferase